jgi:hypothetical protein
VLDLQGQTMDFTLLFSVLVSQMKAEPNRVLQKLLSRQLDPNCTAVREMVEEVAERVLRNLAPQPEPLLAKAKASRG